MNAAVLSTLGKPPRFERFPEPSPGEAAAALKPIDKQMAAARTMPARANCRLCAAWTGLGCSRTGLACSLPGAGDTGFNVIIDYLWGRPTEALLAALTRREFAAVRSETRLVQVGESAGPTISLPAAVLRSTALTILGTAGIALHNVLVDAFQQVMARAASGALRIDTEQVPLSDVEAAWQRDQRGRRLVIIP